MNSSGSISLPEAGLPNGFSGAEIDGVGIIGEVDRQANISLGLVLRF
jgi:hypothetical protein